MMKKKHQSQKKKDHHSKKQKLMAYQQKKTLRSEIKSAIGLYRYQNLEESGTFMGLVNKLCDLFESQLRKQKNREKNEQ